MCANCGFPAAPGHWTEAGAATPSDHDDGTTPGVTLSDRTGRHEMVADVAQVWAAAERMCGRAIDPLDPRFLERADAAADRGDA
jgi:hypothetical protein